MLLKGSKSNSSTYTMAKVKCIAKLGKMVMPVQEEDGMEKNTLKVYIVDDELTIINWLMSNVAWEVYNCEVVGYSTVSVNALAYLDTHAIDVLLTDISMPSLSGLELIRRVKEKQPNIYVIVISAYDKFSYVRDAFRYGIVNYCLKPIDINELYECLRSVNTAQDDRRLSTGLHGKSIFHDSVILNLLNNLEFSNRLEEQCALAGINLTESYYQVVLLNTVGISSEILVDIIDIIKDKKIPGLHCVLDGRMNLILVFIGGKGFDENTEHEIKKILSKANVLFDCSFCIGKPLSHYRKLVESYLSCYDFSRVSFLFSDHNIRVDQYPYEKYLTVTKNRDFFQLANNLRQKKTESVLKIIRRIINNCDTEKEKKAEMICLIVFIIKNIAVYDSDWVFPTEMKCALELFSSEKMLEWLEKILFVSYQKGEINEHLHPYVKFIVKEIHQKYSDKNLSLQEISKHCHVSAAYLGTLFKEQTGEFFNDYLLRVRLIQAEQLLLEGKLKIGTIAEEVGFSNQSYFNKIFRKNYGVSPAEYRRMCQEVSNVQVH